MGLGCFAGESLAATVEGWVIATDAGFETLHDSWMPLGTAQQMSETHASRVIGIRGLIPVVEKVFDGYTTIL